MTPPRPQSEALAEMGTILRSVMSDEPQPELMMSVSEDHALRQMEIQALRQITDNLSRLNTSFDKLHDAVQGVDRRLIRIESNKLEPAVEKLRNEVDQLKDERSQRIGAMNLGQWIVKLAPWTVFAAVFAMVAKLVGVVK